MFFESLISAGLGQLEAHWRANLTNPEAQRAAIAAFRDGRVDLPFDLLIASPDWRPVIEVADKWFRTPFGPTTGFSTAELDGIERRTGWRFPPAMREWWRLAGKHPCCEPWDDSWYGKFLRPDDPGICRGDFLLAHLDRNVGIAFVVHRTELQKPDPEVFEHSEIADPKNYYIDKCMRTRGSVSQIIWQSLLSLICVFDDPPPILKDDVFVLNRHHFMEHDHSRSAPDGAIFYRDLDWDDVRAHFKLVRCPHEIFFNDVDYDGHEIVLGWGKLAVRTSARAAEVDAYVSAAAAALNLKSPRGGWNRVPVRQNPI